MDWLVTIIQFFLRKSLIIILTTTFLNHNTNEKLKFFLHTGHTGCAKNMESKLLKKEYII